MRPPRGEEGSGTVLVVAVMAVVVLLAGLLAAAAAGIAAANRAQHAADLAALAAAASIAVPVGVGLDGAAVTAADPCGLGRRVAERNGADLVGCEVGADGVVQVSVAVREGRGIGGDGHAQARAGPTWVRDAASADAG